VAVWRAGPEAPTDAAVLGAVAAGVDVAAGIRTAPVPATDDGLGPSDAAAGAGVEGVALGVAVGSGSCAAAAPPRIPA
jgi:hypothetical protein